MGIVTTVGARISVDGQEVFLGVTPKSLGYVTLPLRPVVGQSLRIALTAQAQDEEGFDGIVELAGGKAGGDATGDRQEARGTLSVVEVELYAPLAE